MVWRPSSFIRRLVFRFFGIFNPFKRCLAVACSRGVFAGLVGWTSRSRLRDVDVGSNGFFTGRRPRGRIGWKGGMGGVGNFRFWLGISAVEDSSEVVDVVLDWLEAEGVVAVGNESICPGFGIGAVEDALVLLRKKSCVIGSPEFHCRHNSNVVAL